MQKNRGALLTVFAIAFALMALSNFMKPFKMSPNVGFVFFGYKLSGLANDIVGPLFGLILAAYAYGIWMMRRFALPLAHFYATYVILNTLMFTLRNWSTGLPPLAAWIAYVVVGAGVPLASAIILTNRKAELA
ncbi:MAG TPA: hypothetical protein VKR29_12215 [Candidatus Binataceae bacterium]|jgi:hypothetical protein|nr:hypothetical protein [Candidatus Binataceae bacterium]